ncbi:Uncharacterised protein [Legionella cherrii]|uniref:Uncharacterized protein n=1 Tax=Legionella cherrii TaxID=28084 RepID=A0A0W0SA93_9GAMM|nr:hypothetical protein Lche_2063 [Legionella cherrii]VEB38517.1 Uncharacterised protein [Legionella cherrii]
MIACDNLESQVSFLFNYFTWMLTKQTELNTELFMRQSDVRFKIYDEKCMLSLATYAFF